MSSSRRSSTSSIAGVTSPLIDPQPSPELVLVNEVDSPNEELHFSSDDEHPDGFSARPDRLTTSSIPPLSPIVILLYLSVFHLKLGPMFLSTCDTPLSQTLPALFGCAIFAASARQMWYLLARYLRKVDMEDVILDVFARSPGGRRTRAILRTIVRFGTSTMRVLLASVSLRVAVDALFPLVPARFHSVARGVLTTALALVLLPLYAAPSLTAKRIVYATWASLFAYMTWLAAVSYSNVKGISTDIRWQSPGVLWQGITSIAFIFSSSWTLPLYASHRASLPPAVTKRPRRRSFKVLITASISVTVALVLPLCLFSTSSAPSIPEQRENVIIAISSAANLVLTIPTILITAPPISLPFAGRGLTSLTISKVIIYVVTTALSLLPNGASIVLGDILLILSLLSTYVLPAILHITVHFFKRPLSIVLPTSVMRTEDGERDELLQRKERSLQRRRLGRRIVWDLVAWISVFPLGIGGSVWAVGRVLGKW